MKYFLGIDEVGRGPLAGPVMVGVVLVPIDFSWQRLPRVADSKSLSAKVRSTIYEDAVVLQQEGALDFAVGAVSAATIDKIGIVPAITAALTEALTAIEERFVGDLPAVATVRLDGGLRAPARYRDQCTLIKGDVTEPIISLASIVAKVTRDEYMIKLAHKAAYVPYDFASHKGYGTKKHRVAILQHGVSPEHRSSFCRNCQLAQK